MLFKGKYKQRLYIVFLVVTSFFVFGIMGVFIRGAMTQLERDYEATINQSSRTALSSSQIKFEVIHNALELVMDSDEAYEWQASRNAGEFYLGTIKVQEKIQKSISKMHNINFEIAATFVDEDSVIVASTSSEEKSYYFKETLLMYDMQIQAIYDFFESDQREMAFTVYRWENYP